MGDPLTLKNLPFRIAKAAVKWIYVGKLTGARAMCYTTFARIKMLTDNFWRVILNIYVSYFTAPEQ